MALKLTDLTMFGMLAGISDTGRPLDPASTYVGVAVSIADRGADTALSDVTAPPGNMAVRQVVGAWGDPNKLDDGRWVLDGPLLSFAPLEGDDPTVIAAYFLATGLTGGILIAWDSGLTPIPIVNEFNQVNLVPRITIDPDGRWSASVVFAG